MNIQIKSLRYLVVISLTILVGILVFVPYWIMNTLPISEDKLKSLNHSKTHTTIIKMFGEPISTKKEGDKIVLQYSDYRWSIVYIYLNSTGNFQSYEIDW